MNLAKLVLLLSLCWGSSSFHLHSQNLINNNSFEKTDDNNIPIGWTIIAPSVDVIKSQKRIFEKSDASKYNELYEEYFPELGSDGTTYISLYKLGAGSEAITTKINEPLLKGRKYIISIDVFKPIIPGKYPAFEMGISMHSKKPSRCKTQGCYQVETGKIISLSNPKKPILHEGEWITVSGHFISDGTERYIVLSIPHNINLPLVKNNHLVAYLFDNIRLKATPRKDEFEIYFSEGSVNLNAKHISILDSQDYNYIDSIKVNGYSSEKGSSSYNLHLSKLRAQSVTDYFISNNFNKNISTHYHGEISHKNQGKAQKAVVQLFRSYQSSQRYNHHNLYHLIRQIEKMNSKDQSFLRKKNTKEEDISSHNTIIDNYIDSILSYSSFFKMKFDIRTESNLVTLYLHTSNEIQMKFYSSFKKYYDNGFLSKSLWPYIYDRHAFIQGVPQKFGTQFIEKNGLKTLYVIENPEIVDSLRHDHNLDKLDLYLKSISR